jgi:hypothetical protein
MSTEALQQPQTPPPGEPVNPSLDYSALRIADIGEYLGDRRGSRLKLISAKMAIDPRVHMPVREGTPSIEEEDSDYLREVAPDIVPEIYGSALIYYANIWGTPQKPKVEGTDTPPPAAKPPAQPELFDERQKKAFIGR